RSAGGAHPPPTTAPEARPTPAPAARGGAGAPRRGAPRGGPAGRGEKALFFFPTTPADTRWSDLPLSGTFVEMLKRIVSFAGSMAAADATGSSARSSREVLPPTRILDGFGQFGPPPATARALPANFPGRAPFDHPPGLYAPPEGLLALTA